MLHYVLRTGARRKSFPDLISRRSLNCSTRTNTFDRPEGDHYGRHVREVDNGTLSIGPQYICKDCTIGSLAPAHVQHVQTVPPPGRSSVPQEAKGQGPNGLRKCRSQSQPLGSISKLQGVSSIDVYSLHSYELAPPYREDDTTWSWIADEELQDVLFPVLTSPVKRSSNRLLDPTTPAELELRLHQALMFIPMPSLAGLIRYHDAYPSLRSACSYNFLVQLAIRNRSYSRAFRLLQRMPTMGVSADDCSKQLYVRLLVRVGRWSKAWSYVRQELTSSNSKTSLSLLLELLGTHSAVDFNRQTSSESDSGLNAMGESQSSHGIQGPLVQSCQKNVLAVISNNLPSGAPPIHVILTIIRHLLLNARENAARAVSLEWISRLPKYLSRSQRRHCLRLLHLLLAFSGRTFAAHMSNRKFVKLFLQKRPGLRPSSTTLFLLLRSLTRAKGKPTFNALQLVHAFRKKWGSKVIDRRVRRRIGSIAIRDGCLKVARAWLETEHVASAPRILTNLEREVGGVEGIKLPCRLLRRSSLDKLTPGISDENRKWRWLKRRIWRTEVRLSKRVTSNGGQGRWTRFYHI